MTINPGVWFTVTDLSQFFVLLPIGLLLGYLGRLSPIPDHVFGSWCLAAFEMVIVFWVFLLTTRALENTINWQFSIGTFLLSAVFILAIWFGSQIRDWLHR